MKVFFDTSVVIPMIIPSSQSNRLVDRLRPEGDEIFISDRIVEEVRRNLFTSPSLRKWLNRDDEVYRDFLDQLPLAVRVVTVSIDLVGEVPADPDDDHILAAALETSCDFIVSEDRHLLDLGTWRGIAIVDRAGMMAELDRREAEATENPGE